MNSVFKGTVNLILKPLNTTKATAKKIKNLIVGKSFGLKLGGNVDLHGFFHSQHGFPAAVCSLLSLLEPLNQVQTVLLSWDTVCISLVI